MIFVVDVVVENEGLINCEYCLAILRSVKLKLETVDDCGIKK
jgi:hypothetical protein